MSNFQFGSVNGTNVQVGDNNVQNIGISAADRTQLTALLETLHQQVQQAPIPEAARQEITAKTIPAMQEAVKQPDPKPGLTQGLQTLNTNLATATTAASSVASIVGTVAKIAGIIGTGVHVVAPFLASIL